MRKDILQAVSNMIQATKPNEKTIRSTTQKTFNKLKGIQIDDINIKMTSIEAEVVAIYGYVGPYPEEDVKQFQSMAKPWQADMEKLGKLTDPKKVSVPRVKGTTFMDKVEYSPGKNNAGPSLKIRLKL